MCRVHYSSMYSYTCAGYTTAVCTATRVQGTLQQYVQLHVCRVHYSSQKFVAHSCSGEYSYIYCGWSETPKQGL